MWRLVLGTVVTSSAMGFCLLAHLFLGMATGVIAPCASAPDWWVAAYPYAAIWVLPASIAISVAFNRRVPAMFYRKRTLVLSVRRIAIAVVIIAAGNWYLAVVVRGIGAL